ncbi:hypothetical protein CCAX7_53970 [Capsulimonas corticalis]|uniref:Uncharacterized protein n=1 Tax=Capsulimonas corticalis TaxID=2219043 RepID=A0A402CNM0_9BACT|nr:helix-turn-helix transcriptional regulator [Capsulimonas corticalis]BDI33346.1 hypothetical protein CCAX7_53970 [Capsulimonas corticalis]
MKKPSPEQLLADTQSNMTWIEIAEKHGYTDARFLRKLSVRYGLPPRRIIRKPDKSTLEEMIISRGLNIYQVADILGYGSGGWSNIYAYCRQYGITFDFSANAELRRIEFTPQQKSFVYGTLLGDAYRIGFANDTKYQP